MNRILGLLSCLFIFTSCHQTITEVSLCKGKEAIVQQLEGKYLMSFYGETVPVKFKPANEPGRYEMLLDEDELVISTCIIDDKIFFSYDEDPTDPSEPLLVFKMDFINTNKLLISGVALDETKLKQKNIAYDRFQDDGDFGDMTMTKVDNTVYSAEDILSTESTSASVFSVVLIRQ